MFCTNCGTILLENNRFCPQCGRQLLHQISSESILSRALLFIEENEWGKADDYCEQVLDTEPENARAYVIKLMIRAQVKREADLANADTSYADWKSYQNACRFADEDLRKKLEGYLMSTEEAIRIREEEAKKQEEFARQQAWEQQRAALYIQACKYDRSDASIYDLSEAIRQFEKIPNYKDSSHRLRSCKQRLEELQKEQEYLLRMQAKQERRVNIRKKVALVLITLVVAALAVLAIFGVNNRNNERAELIEKHLTGMSFAGEYQQIVSSTSNGSWSLARSVVKYETVFHFKEDGMLVIDTIKSYDEEPFITKNGIRQWDRVDRRSRTTIDYEVKVSLFGQVSIVIEGVQYRLNVNASNIPVSLKNGKITYEVA